MKSSGGFAGVRIILHTHNTPAVQLEPLDGNWLCWTTCVGACIMEGTKCVYSYMVAMGMWKKGLHCIWSRRTTCTTTFRLLLNYYCLNQSYLMLFMQHANTWYLPHLPCVDNLPINTLLKIIHIYIYICVCVCVCQCSLFPFQEIGNITCAMSFFHH